MQIVINNDYICADCGATGEFTSDRAARRSGWAISKDGKRAYCPQCAPFRRNVGATGERRKGVQGKL